MRSEQQFTMYRPSLQCFQSHYGDKNNPKYPPFGSYHNEIPRKEFRDCHEEQNSRPNTPSMTNDSSSRSNSSSVITCDNRGNTASHCSCQNHSEAGSVRYQQSEADFNRSPQMTPSISGRNHKERLRLHTTLRPAVESPSSLSETPSASPRFTNSAFQSQNDLLGVGAGEYRFPAEVNCTEMGASVPDAIDYQTEFVRSAELAFQHPHSATEFDSSETDSADDDDENDADLQDEDEDDDDWNGQDDNLEAIVLEVLQGDLVLAAHLIPILHKSLYLDLSTNVTQKVGPWRRGVTKCSPGTGATGSAQKSSTNTRVSDTTSNTRKRLRRLEPSDCGRIPHEDDEDDEDDEKRSPNELGGHSESEGVVELPRLACPFHKKNQEKYGVQHGSIEGSKNTDYRSCAGPGFKSIQRLKEHFKRKHYPVQCDRCYHIFPGSDRAACVLALETHRQLPTMCERRPASLREGISDAQWANLDRKKSNKKQQATSRIDKWMEIWDIIFPGIPKPETPWYNVKSNSRLPPHSQESLRFAELFRSSLDLQVSQQHIRFLEGSEEVMKDRVENLAQMTFQLYLRLNGNPSSTDSSSAISRRGVSLLGGSFDQIPRLHGHRHSSSASRSTAAQSQAHSMEVSTSPTGTQILRRQRSNIVLPYLGMPHVVPSFVRDSIGSSLSNDQISHPLYQVGLSNNVGGFVPDSLYENTFSTGGNNWEMNFEGAGTHYDHDSSRSSLDAGDFVNISQNAMSQTLIGVSENAASNMDDHANDWEQQLPGSHHMQFEPSQQR